MYPNRVHGYMLYCTQLFISCDVTDVDTDALAKNNYVYIPLVKYKTYLWPGKLSEVCAKSWFLIQYLTYYIRGDDINSCVSCIYRRIKYWIRFIISHSEMVQYLRQQLIAFIFYFLFWDNKDIRVRKTTDAMAEIIPCPTWGIKRSLLLVLTLIW